MAQNSPTFSGCKFPESTKKQLEKSFHAVSEALGSKASVIFYLFCN